jgi:hypothetical protein
MDDFVKFQDEVRYIVGKYNYYIDDINYINLSDKYSVCTNTFFELKEEPQCLEGEFRRVDWCGAWNLPEDLKIVMKNGAFLMYIATNDEYYSRWVHIKPPKPSPVTIHITK